MKVVEINWGFMQGNPLDFLEDRTDGKSVKITKPVNNPRLKHLGLIKHSTADLPDFPFASCFELDIKPGQTAHMAVQAIIKKEQESGFPIQNFKEVEF